MCQSNFDHYIIYPCFVSIDEGYITAFLRRISSCQLQRISREWNLETCQYCGTLEAIFIIDGFPRGCWWFSLSITNQSISLMFNFKIIYSHETKCIRFDSVEDPGISRDCPDIISPPRLRLELCIFDTCAYCIIDPQCTWSWLWSSSCCRSTLYVQWLHLSWFILSWIHTVFLVAMTLFMESSMDLRCIVGSCA